jgi:hypothetical protein
MSYYLEVCIYQAGTHPNGDRTPGHWCFHLAKAQKGSSEIHEILGNPGSYYVGNPPRTKDPRTSRGYERKVPICEKVGDKDEVVTIIRRTPIKSETSGGGAWNCQNWVMDGLERLKNEELISEEDYDEAVAELNDYLHRND